MFAKLLKHESRWLFRHYLPIIWAILLVSGMMFVAAMFVDFSPQNGVIISGMPLAGEIILSAVTFTYVLVMISANIATALIANYRFYKHQFTSNGYLTFTLPVTSRELFFSKFTTSFIGTIVIGALSLLSFNTMVLIATDGKFNIVSETLFTFGQFPSAAGVGMAFTVLISVGVSIVWYYACLCIGQTQRNRIVMSIVAYFVTYMIIQVASLIAIVVLSLVAMSSDTLNLFNEEYMIQNFLAPMVWTVNVIYLAIGAVFVVVSNRIMTRRLNLE